MVTVIAIREDGSPSHDDGYDVYEVSVVQRRLYALSVANVFVVHIDAHLGANLTGLVTKQGSEFRNGDLQAAQRFGNGTGFDAHYGDAAGLAP
jgi:hypothetical protein